MEHVVHPAAVPLVVKTETAVLNLVGDLRPRGRLLGEHQRVGTEEVHRGVEPLDEVDRLEVLLAAEAVRLPLAVLLAVVEI